MSVSVFDLKKVTFYFLAAKGKFMNAFLDHVKITLHARMESMRFLVNVNLDLRVIFARTKLTFVNQHLVSTMEPVSVKMVILFANVYQD